MSVYAYNSLHKSKHSNFCSVAYFFKKSFLGKTSLPVKNSYLLIFPYDKAEILAVCLSKFC